MEASSKKNRSYVFIILHLSLFFSSLSGVASKAAAKSPFLSWDFFFFYGLVLFIMFAYALIWQQILKHTPLTMAYANKPVSLLWGMIWGSLFFNEKIDLNMILGSLIIFAGIYLVVTSDG